jgi:HemY protein
MKFGLLVVVALVISAFAAHFLLQDPGYVVINFRGYLVEMSVPVLLGLLLLGSFLIWALVKLYRAPRRIGQAAGRYRSGRAGQKLTLGTIQIAEGNFARGEKMLARAAGDSDAPLLNYLQAARAAHLLGQDERRDGWLKQAYEKMPEASNAVLLTQAEFQLDQGQYEPALATLRRIEDTAPNHSHALALLGRLYFRLEDWEHLGKLLPRLRKHGRLAPELLDEWAQRVHGEDLERSADAETLAAAWKSVPKALRQNDEVIETYFASMVRVGMHEQAEKDIAAQLKRRWSGPLVSIFGTIDGKDPLKQLKRAEGWLNAHPDDPDLLLATARLCLKNELWGKARSYLETVIALRPSPEAYQEFGRLLNRLGEADAAADAYRAGLGLVSRSPLPAIPHLPPRLQSDEATDEDDDS